MNRGSGDPGVSRGHSRMGSRGWVPAEGPKDTRASKQRRTTMQGSQKTLESFAESSPTESEEGRKGAVSMDAAQSAEKATYDHLIPMVIDDYNIDRALERVVGNRGAPGIDGMTVEELALWTASNREELKDVIESGRYIPTPVRRKEIPKDNGGVRNLGIPTVKDRLVQQMIAQVLEPIYDPTFSDASFGFRPGRSGQDAVMRVREYYDQGYVHAVGIDLEKFFDKMNQEMLMNILRERIKDKVLIQLVKRFLRAGVLMPDGLVHPTPLGAPQGGPLSPLLSNIYLDKMDKEMERRGLALVRYADDTLILLKSRRAAERVCETVTKYLEHELKLKVNREKTEIGSPLRLKFLGFKLSRNKAGTGFVPHPKAVAKFKKRVRKITKRNRGVPLERVLKELNSYTRGWFGYFGMTTSKELVRNLDGWMRRRVRQYVVKQWKRKWTRVKNLKSLCPVKWQCPDGSCSLEWVKLCWGSVRTKSYWKMADSPAVKQGLSNSWLHAQGMVFLSDGWEAVKERCANRRVPNGTHGGVRGQPTD